MNDEAWETFWEGDNFDEIKEEALTSKILSYHDNLHWRIMTELVDISEKELHTPVVFWESTPMPLEFRLHRFDAHLRQHTIQIEKTLKAIGLPFTEAKRLLRLIYAALAEAEVEYDDHTSPSIFVKFPYQDDLPAGFEELAGNAFDEDDGKEDGDGRQGGRDDRGADFACPFDRRLCQRHSALATPEDGLQHDDGIVHEHSDAQSESAQRHHIQ